LSTYLDHHKDLRSPVVYVEFYKLNSSHTCCQIYPSDKFRFTNIDYLNLRDDEVNLFPVTDLTDETIALSIVDVRSDYTLNAILSIIRTIFVSIVLSAGAMLFSKDVEDFIVSPLEKMLEKVKIIYIKIGLKNSRKSFECCPNGGKRCLSNGRIVKKRV
jgi:hypothetical protein